MATKNVPNLPISKMDAVIEWIQRRTAADRAMGLVLHRDYVVESQLVSEVATADLPAVIVRANALKVAMNLHLASTKHHVAADATNTISSADATDQASANTLLNEIKTDLNAHQLRAGGFHDIGGTAGDGQVGAAAGAEATADATDLASSRALADSLAAMWNRHIKSGAPDIAIVAS